jgi:hypothetical protein
MLSPDRCRRQVGHNATARNPTQSSFHKSTIKPTAPIRVSHITPDASVGGLLITPSPRETSHGYSIFYLLHCSRAASHRRSPRIPACQKKSAARNMRSPVFPGSIVIVPYQRDPANVLFRPPSPGESFPKESPHPLLFARGGGSSVRPPPLILLVFIALPSAYPCSRPCSRASFAERVLKVT